MRSESARQSLLMFFLKSVSGGKSGLHRVERQVTPGKCELTESAAESRPPKRFIAGKGERVR